MVSKSVCTRSVGGLVVLSKHTTLPLDFMIGRKCSMYKEYKSKNVKTIVLFYVNNVKEFDSFLALILLILR